MTEREFAEKLRSGLGGMPEKEKNERILFYMESIHDRIEDGMSEDDAIASLGPTEKIISQILADTPLTAIVKDKVKSRRRLRAWEIILLIAGSPLWIALLVVLFACLIAFYAVIGAIIIAAFATFGGIALAGLSCVGGAVALLAAGQAVEGGFALGCGLICVGIAILSFIISKYIVKLVIKLVKLTVLGVKRLFVGKRCEA